MNLLTSSSMHRRRIVLVTNSVSRNTICEHSIPTLTHLLITQTLDDPTEYCVTINGLRCDCREGHIELYLDENKLEKYLENITSKTKHQQAGMFIFSDTLEEI